MPTNIQFILNDRDVCVAESPGLLVLDYLRRTEKLMGTKEGCKEGDCGACVVLIGEMRGDKVVYQPVTSCMVPIGELYGKHLVTIEGLNMDKLSPVQQAIVDEGGTQCGFCTPGIVVSLTGYLMWDQADLSPDGIKKALGGHLCRCTGYGSLKRAGAILQTNFASLIQQHQGDRIAVLIAAGCLPAYFAKMIERLRKIKPLEQDHRQTPFDYLIAGGTDLYVQKGELVPDARVIPLNLHPELKGITRKDNWLHIGALTSFEEFAAHPEVVKIIPAIGQYMQLIASWQIRNRATLGGNIINASPIGDMTALLLALDAVLIFKDGAKQRELPMSRFFKGYKQLDKTATEILTEIRLPMPQPTTKINFEKVSKRKALDIATVNSALRIRCENGLVEEIGLTMGGVAPIPLFLKQTCDYFLGKPLDKATVTAALAIVQNEIAPISDIRGSADYKRLLARQFIIAHCTKLFPESVKARDFYETH